MSRRLSLNFQRLKEHDGKIASWIQVFKLGTFKHDTGDFVIDESFLDNIVKNFEGRQDGHGIPIDYNHANLVDGPDAIAAGWINDLEVREGGLFAKVSWTPRAADFIKNDEFKFISPEFSVEGHEDEFGAEIDGPFLHAAALTNMPFLKGMDPVSLKGKPINGGKKMSDKIAKKLGLKDVDEKGILEALDTMLKDTEGTKKQIETLGELRGTLKLKEGDDVLASVKKLIDGQKLKGEEVVALKDSVVKLEMKNASRDAGEAVTKGMRTGKITPAQKDWATEYALKDKEGFDKYLENAPKIIDFKNTGSDEGDDDTGDPKVDFIAAVEERAKKLNEKNPGAAYTQAFNSVTKEQPKLYNAYRAKHY